MKLRTKAELRRCVEYIEEIYPPKKWVTDLIGNYFIGILAGLKCALGEYPSFAEMDMEDFFKEQFNKICEPPK